MIASFTKYKLNFIRPAGTSRGTMLHRDVWFLFVKDEAGSGKTGVGEIAPLKNLSCDDRPDLERKIEELCRDIENYNYWIHEGLRDFPSIKFGLETAIVDLHSQNSHILFPSEFTNGKKGIPINGLIWMGKPDFMKQQIGQKIAQGFRCIKLKIGAIDFDAEIEIIKKIRSSYPAQQMEIRVDANGAFNVGDAPAKLSRLSELEIHSIEQPIRQGQFNEMADLCKNESLPIALDEELIGVNNKKDKLNLLSVIRPQYIILKPSLHGGMAGCREWIDMAEALNIGWWITSALESNVGLNAIAQWTYGFTNPLPQGLGTGQLFTNNIPSPLQISNASLFYKPENVWDLSFLSDGL